MKILPLFTKPLRVLNNLTLSFYSNEIDSCKKSYVDLSAQYKKM